MRVRALACALCQGLHMVSVARALCKRTVRCRELAAADTLYPRCDGLVCATRITTCPKGLRCFVVRGALLGPEVSFSTS